MTIVPSSQSAIFQNLHSRCSPCKSCILSVLAVDVGPRLYAVCVDHVVCVVISFRTKALSVRSVMFLLTTLHSPITTSVLSVPSVWYGPSTPFVNTTLVFIIPKIWVIRAGCAVRVVRKNRTVHNISSNHSWSYSPLWPFQSYLQLSLDLQLAPASLHFSKAAQNTQSGSHDNMKSRTVARTFLRNHVQTAQSSHGPAQWQSCNLSISSQRHSHYLHHSHFYTRAVKLLDPLWCYGLAIPRLPDSATPQSCDSFHLHS